MTTKTDASMNAELNGVHVPNDQGLPTAWALVFPRPEWDDPQHWTAARPKEAAA